MLQRRFNENRKVGRKIPLSNLGAAERWVCGFAGVFQHKVMPSSGDGISLKAENRAHMPRYSQLPGISYPALLLHQPQHPAEGTGSSRQRALSLLTVRNLERFLRKSKSWAINCSCFCLYSTLQLHLSPKEKVFGYISSIPFVLLAIHYLIWRWHLWTWKEPTSFPTLLNI